MCRYVWAVGLLAAGQSSTMTGTYAGQVNNPKVLKSLIVWNHSLLVVLPCGDVCVLSIVKDNLLQYSEWSQVVYVHLHIISIHLILALCSFV